MYDNCPTRCEQEKSWDVKRKSYCGECPHKQNQQSYFDDDSKGNEGLTQILEQRLGDKATKFDKHKLFSLAIEVAGTEDTPKHKISVKGQRLLSVFLSERHKFDRFKEQTKIKK